MAKLNVGAGSKPIKGWTNHDITKHSPYIHVAWDLTEFPWPTLDLFEEILIKDVLEHIPPNLFFKVVNGLWDLLLPGGKMTVQVPKHNSEYVPRDPTHYRGYELDSFDILDPKTKMGQRNFWYTQKKWNIVEKILVPRTKTNLRFTLIKVDDGTPEDIQDK